MAGRGPGPGGRPFGGGPEGRPFDGPGFGPGGRRPLPPVMNALDRDGDGSLSAREIANAPKSLLTLDRDQDGELSQQELRPPRPPGAPEP